MRVIFAGGGTGGHLYPAIAMAQEVLRRDPASRVLFVGTPEGIESRILSKEGLELKTIRVKGLKGKKRMEQIRALLGLPRALKDSLSILRSFQPEVVVGVGGYASGPLVLASFFMGRKTALQEQNSIPGITNRILGKLVDRIYTAYVESHSYFPEKKILQTGNPIREGFGGAGREEALRHFSLDPDRKTVLVLGGSLGAHAINRIVSDMVRTEDWKRLPVQFLHQTGEADYQEVLKDYGASGVRASVHPYVHEIAQAYAAADLAVSRAGAVALAELCVSGVPSVLIPFPYAADDHQLHNARVMAHAGAAEVLVQEEVTAGKLGERIQVLLADPVRLEKMSKAALGHARPQAARAVVDDLERLAGVH